jgi:hypothetical protein
MDEFFNRAVAIHEEIMDDGINYAQAFAKAAMSFYPRSARTTNLRRHIVVKMLSYLIRSLENWGNSSR